MKLNTSSKLAAVLILLNGVAAAGIIDTSFNPSCEANFYTELLATDDQGRHILLHATEDPETGKPLTRLNLDGSVDSSFAAQIQLLGFLSTDTRDGFIYGLEETGQGSLELRKISVADGTVVTEGFDPPTISGIYGTVYALGDGSILVEGGITAVGGVGRMNIAKFAADGTLLPAFSDLEFTFEEFGSLGDNRFLSYGYNELKGDIFHPDGSVVISGKFTAVNGSPRPGLARFSTDGVLQPDLAGVQIEGRDFRTFNRLSNGDVVLTGGFTSVDGQPRGGLVRFDANGALDPDFNPVLRFSDTFSPQLNSWTFVHDLAGGSFRITAVLEDDNGRFIGQVDETGAEVTSFPRIAIGSLQPAGATMFYKFDASNETSGMLSRIHLDGSADPSFAGVALSYPASVDPWNALRMGEATEVGEGRLLISGGLFNNVDGVDGFHGVLLLSADGRPDRRFLRGLTNQGSYDSSSRFVPLPNDQLMALGYFDGVDGVPVSAEGIVRLNLPPSPAVSYAEYATMAFPTDAPPASITPEADYNGDGVPNAVDYASGETGSPVQVLRRPTGGIEVLFREARTSPGYVLAFEGSPDGQAWGSLDLDGAVPGPAPASPYARNRSLVFTEEDLLFRARAVPVP